MNVQRIFFIFIAAVGIFFTGCGGNGHGSGNSNVSELTVEDSLILLGAQTVVDVPFSFDAGNVFDDDRNVIVAVLLPNVVNFLDGSAELQRPIDDDNVSPSQILSCGDGSSILIFVFDNHDLAGAENPSGDADAQVNFTVVGVQRGQGIISAEAATDSINVNCGNFRSEHSAAVVVQ